MSKEGQTPGKRKKRNLKICTVECHWEDCTWVAQISPNDYQVFSDHIKVHADEFISRLRNDGEATEEKPVGFCCMWRSCAWEGCGDFMDLLRHVMHHGYHALLKGLGNLVQTEMNLATCHIEMEDPYSMLVNTNLLTCNWKECLTEYACPNQFYRHVEKHVMDPDADENENSGKDNVLRCYWEACNSTFKNKYKLKEHVRVHTHEKIIACPDCGGMFSNQTKLLDHLSRQNTESFESFQCSHCLKRCASERLLRDHMRHHVNYLKCPHCDMTCPNPGSLKYHIAYRHTDNRPFSCAMCENSFKSHSDLVRHEESHLEKSYMCEVEGCKYSTKTQHCLKRHIRVMHSNTEKRYICHICNSEYSRGFGLTKHLKKKHNFSWPSGHPRFRYIQYDDGFYRLQMVRFESIELTKRLQNAGVIPVGEDVVYERGDNIAENIEYPIEGYSEVNGDNAQIFTADSGNSTEIYTSIEDDAHYSENDAPQYNGDNSEFNVDTTTDVAYEEVAHSIDVTNTDVDNVGKREMEPDNTTVYFDPSSTSTTNNDFSSQNVLYTSVAFQTNVKDEGVNSAASDYIYNHKTLDQTNVETFLIKQEESEKNSIVPECTPNDLMDSSNAHEELVAMTTEVTTTKENCTGRLSGVDSGQQRNILDLNEPSQTTQRSTGEIILQPKPSGYDKSVMAQLVALAKKQAFPYTNKSVNSSIVSALYERLKSSMSKSRTDENLDTKYARSSESDKMSEEGQITTQELPMYHKHKFTKAQVIVEHEITDDHTSTESEFIANQYSTGQDTSDLFASSEQKFTADQIPQNVGENIVISNVDNLNVISGGFSTIFNEQPSLLSSKPMKRESDSVHDISHKKLKLENGISHEVVIAQRSNAKPDHSSYSSIIEKSKISVPFNSNTSVERSPESSICQLKVSAHEHNSSMTVNYKVTSENNKTSESLVLMSVQGKSKMCIGQNECHLRENQSPRQPKEHTNDLVASHILLSLNTDGTV